MSTTADQSRDRPPGGVPGPVEPERLHALYESDMEDLARFVDRRGTTMEEVDRVLSVIESGDPHLTSHKRMIAESGLGFHDARTAALVLSDMGDVHEAYDKDEGWELYWVRCDGFIVEKCEQRRISLLRYFQMHDVLKEFQDKCIEWYVRRNRRQSQPFKLRDLKAQYVYEIQSRFFPEKPVKKRIDSVDEAPDGALVSAEDWNQEGDEGLYYVPDDPSESEWSRHIAARYVRTAQDSIIRSFDLSY